MESFTSTEILETKKMIDEQGLDVRTITMGINLLDCANPSLDKMKENINSKIFSLAENLSEIATTIEEDYGIPIINRRITVTPISLILGSLNTIQEIPLEDIQAFNDPFFQKYNIKDPKINQRAIDSCIEIAQCLDNISEKVKVDFLGGFSALVHKGFTRADLCLIQSLPEVLSKTERVCSSINLATTRSGMNMNAVKMMGKIIHQIAMNTRDRNSIGCAKIVVFCNAVEDNPFMAGGFHGIGESECCINVGVSGPGVIRNVVKNQKKVDFETLAEIIKKTAFKITRMGQLVAQQAAKRLHIPFGIVDISLAPTNRPFDSVAGILEEMGIEITGGPGTTAALALLTDAVKKGGLMASSYVGGLSGAFIPVSEDKFMTEAARKNILTIEKLEAMTSVCSVGLDMVCIPGSTPPSTISGIIADEAAIGMINNKTTGTRIIPVIGKKVNETVEFGGLLGKSIIMPVKESSCEMFINRQGRIPAPVHSQRN
ncbi:MAG: PFL family protein [Candidatus Lokiarchaeota archaeon]|nr:PFL family protein [Candidatus Lokiarchaeota archaeon]